MAINGSPRKNWNTDTLVQEAARGAESRGAKVEVIDLYRLEQHTGCISCFGCKRQEHFGTCVCKDGLAPVLEKIRDADGLILGSPIYLGEATAEVRALYERLIFPYVTYKTEPKSYCTHKMPVVLIFTSNCPEAAFPIVGYNKVLDAYKKTMKNTFGSVEVLISSDTLQVKDYEKYDWTMFDAEKKKAHHETVFPKDKEAAFHLGIGMVNDESKPVRQNNHFIPSSAKSSSA